jgi:predicted RNase H-like HicB family nuclease
VLLATAIISWRKKHNKSLCQNHYCSKELSYQKACRIGHLAFFIRILIINREPLVIMANKMHEFDVVLMEDETGGYVALVPALPGCHTQGDTLEETLENVKEAIDLYMETLTEKEKKELLKQKVVGIQKVKALA